MTLLFVGFGLSVAVAGAVALALVRARPSRLLRANVAGRSVPAVLAPAFVLAMATGGFPLYVSVVGLSFLIAFASLFAVGLVDDLVAGEARGFREHLSSALRLRPTTGILKLAVGVGAATWVAVVLDRGAVHVVAAAVAMAVSTNLWNALDVRPGRALKWALISVALLAPAWWGEGFSQVAAPLVGAALVLLPLDLTERGMLGDAGSNPLGFAVGFALATALPTAGVIVAAAAVLALQVAAETVTISRLIDAVPPLRWFDRLGRRPETAGPADS